jgi:hypothetical protein
MVLVGQGHLIKDMLVVLVILVVLTVAVGVEVLEL